MMEFIVLQGLFEWTKTPGERDFPHLALFKRKNGKQDKTKGFKSHKAIRYAFLKLIQRNRNNKSFQL